MFFSTLAPNQQQFDKVCTEHDGVAHFIYSKLSENKTLNYSMFIIHLQLYMHN